MIRKLGATVLDLLFPPRCPWCGGLLRPGVECGCASRVGALCLPHGPLPHALDEAAKFTAAQACFAYDAPVRDAILRFKFEDESELADMLGGYLAEKYEACGLAGQVDIVLPAPVSPGTLRRRGYNQSALLAKPLARASGVPMPDKALRKAKDTVPQMTLDREGRLSNLSGDDVFSVDASQVQGLRVLLVDDIFTTGATANACAGALLAAGAAQVQVLCLAAAGQS